MNNMGNIICKKCSLPIDSHLLKSHESVHERRHCYIHNICHGKCLDCDNCKHTHCYHKFYYSILQ